MNITLISSDDGDWEGIYVDGVLQAEGHSLSPSQVFEALGLGLDKQEINFEELGITSCPYKLEELEAADKAAADRAAADRAADRAAEIKAGAERLREIFPQSGDVEWVIS